MTCFVKSTNHLSRELWAHTLLARTIYFLCVTILARDTVVVHFVCLPFIQFVARIFARISDQQLDSSSTASNNHQAPRNVELFVPKGSIAFISFAYSFCYLFFLPQRARVNCCHEFLFMFSFEYFFKLF